jgi:hypothetical protein
MSKGQAVLIAVIFFMIISVTVIFGFALPILTQAKIVSDLAKSRQSFFLAEAGLEDVIYRIKREDFNVSQFEQIDLNGFTADVSIEDALQSKNIISTGNFQSYFRKIKTRLVIAEGTSFHYGVQVGDGGLQMDNDSEVQGNVFSNGNITAQNNSRIFGTAIVAEPNGITRGRVFGDIYADSCSNARLLGEDRTLHTYGPTSCTGYDVLTDEGLPIEPLDLPISDEQIEDWKNIAFGMGGICQEPVCDSLGNYVQPVGTSGSLGPVKIIGNLVVETGATLEITGTIWVAGNAIIRQNATVYLSPDVYGSNGGMIISDGEVLLENNSASQGTGEEESYMMYISTSNSPQAIDVGQGETEAAIVYSNTGTIVINNEANLLEVVGYGVHLKNNSVITYDTGLANTIFSNGPGGVFQILNWREIE